MMCMVAIRNSDFSRFASETRLRSYLKFSKELFKTKHPIFQKSRKTNAAFSKTYF